MQRVLRACCRHAQYKVPSFFTENLRDLCKNIITADLTRRYGNLRRGVRDIKEHPWFAEIRWSQVYEKRVRRAACDCYCSFIVRTIISRRDLRMSNI